MGCPHIIITLCPVCEAMCCGNVVYSRHAKPTDHVSVSRLFEAADKRSASELKQRNASEGVSSSFVPTETEE